MKSVVKKVAIFSMIGMMQIGLGTSLIEASSLHNEPFPQQQDNRHHDRDQGQDRHEQERREKERHRRHRYERERIENERHERAMERRRHESYREWRERQRHENRRHAENMRRIAHNILDLVFDR